MIHMSKYLRNAISNDELYHYIVEEGGGDSFARASEIMPEAFGYNSNHVDLVALPYEAYVKELKKRGHALVEMRTLYEDFLKEGQVSYEGTPPEDSKKLASGHGMLLIGVYKDTKVHPEIGNNLSPHKLKSEDNLGTPLTQVHLLLQNWWPEKPFLKVRLDYFLYCNGSLRFSNGEKVNEVTDDRYTTKTCGVRRAITAAPMENGIIRRGVK